MKPTKLKAKTPKKYYFFYSISYKINCIYFLKKNLHMHYNILKRLWVNLVLTKMYGITFADVLVLINYTMLIFL